MGNGIGDAVIGAGNFVLDVFSIQNIEKAVADIVDSYLQQDSGAYNLFENVLKGTVKTADSKDVVTLIQNLESVDTALAELSQKNQEALSKVRGLAKAYNRKVLMKRKLMMVQAKETVKAKKIQNKLFKEKKPEKSLFSSKSTSGKKHKIDNY